MSSWSKFTPALVSAPYISGSMNISGAAYQGSLVTSVAKSGSAAVVGDITLEQGSAITLTQTGKNIKIDGLTAASPYAGPMTEETTYGLSSNVGMSTYYSKGDHTHGSPSLSNNNPQDIGSTAYSGSGDTPSHDDHVHVGVHSNSVLGSTNLFGDVDFTGSGGTTVSQTGQILTISSSAVPISMDVLYNQLPSNIIIYSSSANGGPYFAESTSGSIIYSGSSATYVINAALNSLTSGRTWQEKAFLKGNFIVTGSILIPSYTLMEIDGKIVADSGLNAPVIMNPNLGSNDPYITIKGGFIDGNASGQASGIPAGIYLAGATDALVQDVNITNTYDFGLVLSYLNKRTQVISCNFTSCGSTITKGCIYIGVSSYGYGSTKDILIDKCYMSGSAQHGVYLSSGSPHVTISNCTIEKYGRVNNDCYGISVRSDHCICSNNKILNPIGTQACGIGDLADFHADNVLLTNNIIYNTLYYGIQIYGKQWVVEGNIVSGSNIGIFLRSGSNNDLNSNKILNNATGIGITDGANYTIVNNNYFSGSTVGLSGWDTGTGSMYVNCIGNIFVSNTYGITQNNLADYWTINDNIFQNNGTVMNLVGTNNMIKHNRGYITDNYGYNSISNGGTIAHGCVAIPKTISLTASGSIPAYFSYTADATNITVYHTVGGSLGVFWRAEV